MPPLRRYLRLTRTLVLETRIYADPPSLITTLLLNPRDPLLPTIIRAIQPLVLPKLREENDRAKAGGKKNKHPWKDTVREDGWEASFWFAGRGTGHSVLRRGRVVREGEGVRVRREESEGEMQVRREESEEEEEELGVGNVPPAAARRDDNAEEGLFVSSDDDEAAAASPPPARKKRKRADGEADLDADDKKKLAFETTYEGFAIYGRVLCLVVRKRGKGKEEVGKVLENWMAGTQEGIGGGDGGV